MNLIQTALSTIYPPRCVGCGHMVESDFSLCGPCWRETRFIGGTTCDACGIPLLGDATADSEHCDDCLKIVRPWDHGRSAFLYADKGRDLILALKHGDRQDIARPAGRWLANAARDILLPEMLIVPVPLHWRRRVHRRYNQAALLAQALAEVVGCPCRPDFLERPQRTPSLDGRSPDERFRILQGKLRVAPRRKHCVAGGRPVLVVDDVMTSGATLAAATEACREAGAGPICVVTLARVAKDA